MDNRPLLTYENEVHNKRDSGHEDAQPADVKANCHNDYSGSDFSSGPDSNSEGLMRRCRIHVSDRRPDKRQCGACCHCSFVIASAAKDQRRC